MDNGRRRPPSLKYIILSCDSISELQTWASENQLTHHPSIKQRLHNILNTINDFSDVSCLIGWAINNGDLNHESVQNRIHFFLTCKWCRVRFTLTDELLEHEKVHEILDELVDKPPIPLSQDNSGYGTLSHRQNGSFNTSMEVPMPEISLNNTKTVIWKTPHIPRMILWSFHYSLILRIS